MVEWLKWNCQMFSFTISLLQTKTISPSLQMQLKAGILVSIPAFAAPYIHVGWCILKLVPVDIPNKNTTCDIGDVGLDQNNCGSCRGGLSEVMMWADVFSHNWCPKLTDYSSHFQVRCRWATCPVRRSFELCFLIHKDPKCVDICF